MDDRIVFIMELNAWTNVLHHMLQELKIFLTKKGNLLKLILNNLYIQNYFRNKLFLENLIIISPLFTKKI